MPSRPEPDWTNALRIQWPYNEVFDPGAIDDLPDELLVGDHLNGITSNGTNAVLDRLQHLAHLRGRGYHVWTPYIPTPALRERYPELDLAFPPKIMIDTLYSHFGGYRQHPDVKFSNFLCSFNGSMHMGRCLLVAALHRQGWTDPNYVSKNFITNADEIDGYLQAVSPLTESIDKVFFLGKDSNQYLGSINDFQYHRSFHGQNLKTLEHQLTTSFVHVVSESLATGYEPFVTEKFVYSVLTRGLFVAWAQHHWHAYLRDYYGFKLYDRIFDYDFDSIDNPVRRLIRLIEMLGKFSRLTTLDWHDLYVCQLDEIEYNYQHFASGAMFDRMQAL